MILADILFIFINNLSMQELEDLNSKIYKDAQRESSHHYKLY